MRRMPPSSRACTSRRARASHETQRYGQIVAMPHGLAEKVARNSVAMLNQALADTITLRDMYKKHHWQVVGPTFNELHLLFDKHFEAQVELVDLIAERIQVLGGISLAMAADIAEETKIPRLPRGREAAPVQLSRLHRCPHADHQGGARQRREGAGRRRLRHQRSAGKRRAAHQRAAGLVRVRAPGRGVAGLSEDRGRGVERILSEAEALVQGLEGVCGSPAAGSSGARIMLRTRGVPRPTTRS